MEWSTITNLGGHPLVHVRQDLGSNQCVAASLAMICKNMGYSGHRFGESSLFAIAAKAMRETHNELSGNNMPDKAFVSKYGIRTDTVSHYLKLYGFTDTHMVSSDDSNAEDLAESINALAPGDSAIISCGVDSLHALAAFRLNNRVYVLNPDAWDEAERGCVYINRPVVQIKESSAYGQFLKFMALQGYLWVNQG